MGECGEVSNLTLTSQSFQPGSKFTGARMIRTSLRNLTAENASFYFAQLIQSDLSGARVRGSDFRYARLSGIQAGFGSNFEDCNFEQTEAMGADFNMARFDHARFNGSRFNGSNFRNANFYFADLTFANFEGSDFRGADLSFADLFATRLNGAYYDSFTRLPFDRAEATRQGMIFTH
jgi:uncharacterized protein YjbI with pentapeptide repeats